MALKVVVNGEEQEPSTKKKVRDYLTRNEVKQLMAAYIAKKKQEKEEAKEDNSALIVAAKAQIEAKDKKD